MSDEFFKLKDEIEAHQRRCGYYIITLVDVAELRSRGATQEEIADEVFRRFDDQDRQPDPQRVRDQLWADYSVERDLARRHAVDVLVGGHLIGQTRETISPLNAERYFDRFAALFKAPATYYVGMGFGDRKYVFQHGVAAISPSRAGVLWVVEDD